MSQTRKPAVKTSSRASSVPDRRVPANKGRKYPAEVLGPEEVTALQEHRNEKSR